MVKPTTLAILCLSASLSSIACRHVNSSEACLRELKEIKPLARVRMIQQVPPRVFAGVVLDSATKRPLASSQVQFRDLRLAALTDSSGSFRIRNVPAGKHDLVVRRIGYYQMVDTVSFVDSTGIAAVYDLVRDTRMGCQVMQVTPTTFQDSAR
jgi:hypothetical protein